MIESKSNYQIIYTGINYKTEEKTINWVKSINKMDSKSLIIVVDNSGSDNPKLQEKLEKLEILNLIYIDTKENLGYFNGAEKAYEFVLSHRIKFEWFVVSNVDIALETQDPEKILGKYKDAAVVAPKIESCIDGFDKNPYRIDRSSKKTMIFKKNFFRFYPLATLYNKLSSKYNSSIKKEYTNKPKCPEGTKIYLPYGACFIFNKLFFEKGGTIKYPFFLFGEELYIAEQCRTIGLDIKYVPSVKFINFEHASTGSLPSKYIIKQNYKIYKYILDKYY